MIHSIHPSIHPRNKKSLSHKAKKKRKKKKTPSKKNAHTLPSVPSVPPDQGKLKTASINHTQSKSKLLRSPLFLTYLPHATTPPSTHLFFKKKKKKEEGTQVSVPKTQPTGHSPTHPTSNDQLSLPPSTKTHSHTDGTRLWAIGIAFSKADGFESSLPSPPHTHL